MATILSSTELIFVVRKDTSEERQTTLCNQLQIDPFTPLPPPPCQQHL